MMKYIKKIIYTILLMTVILKSTELVYAQENLGEWYEIEIVENDEYFDEISSEISARGYLIGTVASRIADMGSGQVAMRVDVHCYEKMSEIKTILMLQKIINGTWTTVGSVTVSVEDSYDMTKTAIATGVTSGTYRVQASTKVTHPTGKIETMTCASGAIAIN